MRITKIRHSTILIETKEHVIYFDPYLDPFLHSKLPKADLILITNPDYDHGNQESVDLIRTASTKVYGPRSASDDINLDILAVGDERESGKSRFKVVSVNHPRLETQGYKFESESQLIYYPGDTAYDATVSREQCTILLLPITTGLMDLATSVKFVQECGAQYVIPVHYGELSGDENDARWFSEAVTRDSKCKAILLSNDESAHF